MWHFQTENLGLKFKIMKERRLVIEHKNWGRRSHASWARLKVKGRSKNLTATFKVCFPQFERWSPTHNSFYYSIGKKFYTQFSILKRNKPGEIHLWRSNYIYMFDLLYLSKRGISINYHWNIAHLSIANYLFSNIRLNVCFSLCHCIVAFVRADFFYE